MTSLKELILLVGNLILSGKFFAKIFIIITLELRGGPPNADLRGIPALGPAGGGAGAGGTLFPLKKVKIN